MALDRCLQDLADEQKPLKPSGLLQLSGLSSEEVRKFKLICESLPPTRKYEVLTRVAELGEDNLELDFSAIFRACLGDDDDEVREKATLGLLGCDDRVIIRPLVGLVTEDASAKVRAAAAMSLGKFADMAQDGKILTRDAERVLEALLSAVGKEGEDVEVRRRAIESVASFESPEVEQIIRDAYASGDPMLKQAAIYAMGRSSDSRWLPLVLEETHHDDPAIRYEAANASGQLGDETTVPHLIRLIEDEETHVQMSAVQALGTIGGPLAKRALIQCTKLGDESLEEASRAALDSMELDEDPLGFRFQT